MCERCTHYAYCWPSKRPHIHAMHIDDIEASRIDEDINVPRESTGCKTMIVSAYLAAN